MIFWNLKDYIQCSYHGGRTQKRKRKVNFRIISSDYLQIVSMIKTVFEGILFNIIVKR